jgi:hypothetical protein
VPILICAGVLIPAAAIGWLVLGGGSKSKDTGPDGSRAQKQVASAPPKKASEKAPTKTADKQPSKEPEAPPANKEAPETKEKQAAPAPMTAAEARARLQSIKNLHVLVMALQDYNDAYKRLPPAGGAADPKLPALAGMSWRTYLLPYLGKQAVYEQLLKNQYPAVEGQPWNRPELLKLDFAPFSSPVPEKGKPGYTHYRVFIGSGAAFEPKEQTRIPHSFRDGTSSTVFIVEAAEPVPWTKPEELVYDPQKPLPKLGGLFADGFYAAFGDGTVRFLPNDLGDKLIRAAVTRSDGEDILGKLPPLVNTQALARLAGLGAADKEPKEIKKQPITAPKGKLVTAEELAEDFVTGRDGGFAQKYNTRTYLRIRGQLKIVGNEAYFIPGKKLTNGEPVKIGLAIGGLDRLGKARDGSTVIAEGYPDSQPDGPGPIIQKCRLVPVVSPPPKGGSGGIKGSSGFSPFRDDSLSRRELQTAACVEVSGRNKCHEPFFSGFFLTRP